MSFKELYIPNKVTQRVEGVGTTETIIDLGENYTLIDSIELAAGGIRVTDTGAVVPPVAGDDITVQGAFEAGTDGHEFNLGESNAAVVIGLDDNGVTTIDVTARYLHFTAAQVLATETWTLWLTRKQ